MTVKELKEQFDRITGADTSVEDIANAIYHLTGGNEPSGDLVNLIEAVYGPDMLDTFIRLFILYKAYFDKVRSLATESAEGAEAARDAAEAATESLGNDLGMLLETLCSKGSVERDWLGAGKYVNETGQTDNNTTSKKKYVRGLRLPVSDEWFVAATSDIKYRLYVWMVVTDGTVYQTYYVGYGDWYTGTNRVSDMYEDLTNPYTTPEGYTEVLPVFSVVAALFDESESNGIVDLMTNRLYLGRTDGGGMYDFEYGSIRATAATIGGVYSAPGSELTTHVRCRSEYIPYGNVGFKLFIPGTDYFIHVYDSERTWLGYTVVYNTWALLPDIVKWITYPPDKSAEDVAYVRIVIKNTNGADVAFDRIPTETDNPPGNNPNSSDATPSQAIGFRYYQGGFIVYPKDSLEYIRNLIGSGSADENSVSEPHQIVDVNSIPVCMDSEGKDIPYNSGVEKAYRKAHQLLDIKWTPVEGTIPTPSSGSSGSSRESFSNSEVTGMVYSSTKEIARYVPIDVSLHTYMTAMHNPYSLLYTEDIHGNWSRSSYGFTYNGNNNCGPYYGTVCSTFVGYALGWKTRWETASFAYLSKIGFLTKIHEQSCEGVRLMDLVWQPGHVALITDISRDTRGMPVAITVSEARGNYCKSTVYKTKYTPPELSNVYNKDDFDVKRIIPNPSDDFDGGIIYRYTYLTANVEYEASQYVQVEYDPEPVEPTYNNDICTFAGDKVTFKKGDEICVNYNKGTYTSLVIVRDSSEIQTVSLPNDYNITHSIDITDRCGTAGKYEAYLTDGTTSSNRTEFEVIEAGISISGAADQLTVNFNDVEEPLYLEIVGINGQQRGLYELTEMEKTAKTVIIDVNNLEEQYDVKYDSGNYIRLVCKGIYGRATTAISDDVKIN